MARLDSATNGLRRFDMVTWHDGLMMWQSRIAGAFGPVGLELLQQYVRQLRLLSGLGANSALVALASYQVDRAGTGEPIAIFT